MAEQRFRAVIFDMDGVLIDSGGVYRRHWLRWAAAHGVDEAAVVATHPGRPPQETIRLVAPELDARAEAARFNAGLVDEDASGEVRAMPGAVELVRGLPDGVWNVATSAVGAMALQWLGDAGIPVPDGLVSVEDVARGKPAPDPYLLAARRLGTVASRCLVIEDAPAGISAAKAAGATVLAVRTTHADEQLGEADARVDDLTHVTIVVDDQDVLVSWPDVSQGSRR